MLKLLPLLILWYRMGAFTKPWAAPGAPEADVKAMRRATKTAFYIMLAFSLAGFIGPALLPVLRHSEAANTFSTVMVIAGFAIGLVFDIRAELLRRKATAATRQSIYFPPAWLKKNERFLRGVEKFIAYQEDLMPPEKREAVQAVRQEYEDALSNPDKEALDAMEKRVLKVCETAVPEYNASPLKENLEVIIVAIIVALGIRAYYLQPFKIPTASMQPTLNGIVGTRQKEGEEKPNIITQAWQYVWNGRNYVECRVPSEWGEVELTHFQQTSKANFFTFTTLYFSNEQTLTAYAPARQLLLDICQNSDISRAAAMAQVGSDDNQTRVPFQAFVEAGQGRPVTLSDGTSRVVGAKGVPVKGGDLIARGYIESGDQLLVDKFSYHFRNPRRDEVFVFSTREIPVPGQRTPQHYIKRLVALPGDKVEVDAPHLIVNGEQVTLPGSSRVMSAENGYKGYFQHGMPEFTSQRAQGPGIEVHFPKPGYTALGDNSENSQDSRYWGGVPERNIVGPAMFVYWPFANHWGLIP